MIKEGKIGVQEAVCLVVIATGNRVFFSAPAIVAQFSGTAGWCMSLVSNITSIIFFSFIYLLLKRFPGKDILEIFNVVLGSFLGFICAFVYSASFLAASGILLREFLEILRSFDLPHTPSGVLSTAMIIVVVAAVFLGLETIARSAKLWIFFALFMYFLLLILSAQNFKLSNLFPVLGYGIGNTVFEGVTRSSAYSEVIILAVLAGSLQGAKHIKKAGYISLCLSGVLLTVGILCIQLVFPYYTLQEQIAPLYTLATLSRYGNFFQRLDPAFLTLWLIITIISTSIVFYCAVSSYCKTFRLQDRRPIIVPLAVLLFTITTIPRDLPSVIFKYIEILRILPVFIFYVFPAAVLILAIILKKKGVEKAC